MELSSRQQFTRELLEGVTVDILKVSRWEQYFKLDAQRHSNGWTELETTIEAYDPFEEFPESPMRGRFVVCEVRMMCA